MRSQKGATIEHSIHLLIPTKRHHKNGKPTGNDTDRLTATTSDGATTDICAHVIKVAAKVDKGRATP